jgi:hypothetical protein
VGHRPPHQLHRGLAHGVSAVRRQPPCLAARAGCSSWQPAGDGSPAAAACSHAARTALVHLQPCLVPAHWLPKHRALLLCGEHGPQDIPCCLSVGCMI